MKLKKFLPYLIGFGLFFLILSRIDISETLSILKQTNLPLFLTALLMIFPTFFLKTLRWKYIMKLQKINYSLNNIFLMYLAPIPLGLVTPGRFGEMLRTSYLKNDGYSLGKSFFSVFFDRFSDIVFLLMFGYVSMFFFAKWFQREIIILTLVFSLAVLIFLLVLAKRHAVKKLTIFFLNNYVFKKHREMLKGNLHDFIASARILGLTNVFVIASLTALSFVFHYFYYYLLAISLGIQMELFFFIFAITLIIFVNLVPITVSGIGTRDLVLVFLFSLVGISQELAIAYSAIILVSVSLFSLVCMAAWIKKPVKLQH